MNEIKIIVSRDPFLRENVPKVLQALDSIVYQLDAKYFNRSNGPGRMSGLTVAKLNRQIAALNEAHKIIRRAVG